MKGCSICPLYSRKLDRCVRGKIFPKTIKGGTDAARWMGISYLCEKSPITMKVWTRLQKERKGEQTQTQSDG